MNQREKDMAAAELQGYRGTEISAAADGAAHARKEIAERLSRILGQELDRPERLLYALRNELEAP